MTPYYQDSAVTIYHGDAAEVLPCLTVEGVIITDPPYGINYSTEWNRNGPDRARSIEGDSSVLIRDSILGLWVGPSLVFGSWKSPKPSGVVLTLVWEKMGSSGMGDLALPWRPNTEEIYVIGSGFVAIAGRESGVLRFKALCGEQRHPTEKPASLMRYLIERTIGTVTDPFMGSGTTLRAAKDLGRKAIGIEIEEKYCEIAAKRMAQEVFDFGLDTKSEGGVSS